MLTKVTVLPVATVLLAKVPVAATVNTSLATMPLNTAPVVVKLAVVPPSYTLSLAAMPDTVMALAVMLAVLLGSATS